MVDDDNAPRDRVAGRTLADILDTLEIGAFYVDHTDGGKITDGTDAFVRMFGYTERTDIIGKPAGNYYADPKERAEAAARIYGHPDLKRLGYVRFEAQRLHADGTPIEVLMSLIPTYADDGRVLGAHVLIERLGQRHEADKAFRLSEERFRILFDTSPVGMALTTPDGRVMRANASLCGFLGRAEDTLLGTPLVAFVHPEDRARAEVELGSVAHAESNGLERHGLERRFVHADGRTLWGSVSSSWLEDQGVPHSRVVILQDMTQRKHLDEVLARSEKMAAVGLLAGGIAHNFNNLLSTILGNLTLAAFDLPADGPAREPLEQATAAATRARDLTHQLITFARGGGPVKQAVPVMQIARDAGQLALAGRNSRLDLGPLAGPLAERRGGAPAPEEAAPIWGVEVDPAQVSQLFQNLFINAAEAMPAGGVISVRATNVTIREGPPSPSGASNQAFGLPTLSPGRYVRVDVVDHGVGIAPEVLPRIFEPYFSTKDRGRGLGLPAVLSIAERHGGHIDVQSQVGVGTKFTLYLPALQPGTVIANDGVSARALSLANLRVLLMDDEESVRLVAAACLRRAGAAVEMAEDGERAVAAHARALDAGAPFSVVLLDLTVRSGLGGIDAARRITAREAGARCVVMSGYADDPVLTNPRAYGFVGVVPKPFTYQQLVATVRDVVETRTASASVDVDR